MTLVCAALISLSAAGPAVPIVAQDAGQAPAPAAAVQASAAAWTADLPIASDGRHLWLWAEDYDSQEQTAGVRFFHADTTHTPPDGPAWESVARFQGTLAAHAVAADDATLWLVFSDGAVKTLSLRPGRLPDQWFLSQSSASALPASATVYATAAAHHQLYVLVRVASAADLAELDRPQVSASAKASDDSAARDVRLNLALGLPPTAGVEASSPIESSHPEPDGASTESSDPAAPGEAEPSPSAPQAADPPSESHVDAPGVEAPPDSRKQPQLEAAPKVPADRLLVLDRGRWRVIPLPPGWESGSTTHLIAPREPGGRPSLAVPAPHNRRNHLTLHRPADEGWTATDFDLAAAGRVLPLHVREQTLFVQHTPIADGFAARVLAVRGDTLIPIGQVQLDDDTGTPVNGRWTAVRYGNAVGILAGDRRVARTVMQQIETPEADASPPGPTVTVIGLTGQTVAEPWVMPTTPDDPLGEAADLLILVGVGVTSTILLFTFWRRDPTANQLQLPGNLAPADLLRRALAAAIDLTPCLLLVSMWYEIPIGEVYARWPGRGSGATFEMLLPGLVVIGLLVLHTTVAEMVTGRSLGKLATGLRVTDLAGRDVRAWQALVRGPLKAFDLIAYFLIILPVISPYRQRLGDMVARTVVVAKAPPPRDDADLDRDPSGGR